MIFKVYYQESTTETPIRENTKSLYIEGESERDIRKKLINAPINIELITPLEGAILEYEKQSKYFKVLEI